MKLWINKEFRIGREPFKMVLEIFKLPIQVEQIPAEKICQPYLTLIDNN